MCNKPCFDQLKWVLPIFSSLIQTKCQSVVKRDPNKMITKELPFNLRYLSKRFLLPLISTCSTVHHVSPLKASLDRFHALSQKPLIDQGGCHVSSTRRPSLLTSTLPLHGCPVSLVRLLLVRVELIKSHTHST